MTIAFLSLALTAGTLLATVYAGRRAVRVPLQAKAESSLWYQVRTNRL